MAVVDLRCDAVPWPCFRPGPTAQHQFGIHAGNFIQFVFPATDAFPAQSGFFSFALYITKVALKGRVVLENPDQVGDPSAAQVTQLVGIILPLLLHNSVHISEFKGSARLPGALPAPEVVGNLVTDKWWSEEGENPESKGKSSKRASGGSGDESTV